ncbi:hypothetical protein ABZ671_10720 [Micromonospora sp. NPDC006766]|uniref:hypothetical protein n=1 Tax=Micromonospora sp. NPDC006766 TaxID=3154778 RepID=UPI0033DE207C
MTAWIRWKIATPLIGLSVLVLIAAVFGTWAWWSFNGPIYRALSVIICLVAAATFAAALSVGIKPARDVPWLRIGLVGLGILTNFGLAALQDYF